MRVRRLLRQLRLMVITLAIWTVLVPAAFYYSLPRLAATEEVGLRAALALALWLFGVVAIGTALGLRRSRRYSTSRRHATLPFA